MLFRHLEGFWWQDGVDGVDYTDKSAFNWISVIRIARLCLLKRILIGR